MALESFRPITTSAKDTCETKRQVAAHNSAYDTLKKSKLTVYKAKCEPRENVKKQVPVS